MARTLLLACSLAMVVQGFAFQTVFLGCPVRFRSDGKSVVRLASYEAWNSNRLCRSHQSANPRGATLVFLQSLRAARAPVDTKLAASSKSGAVKDVGELLKSGANPNACDEWGSTCLHLAVKAGKTQIVDLLLENGADPHRASHSDDETTPLHCAALAGHADIVASLLKKGADVLRKDEFGSTALQLAMKKQHREVVDLLKPEHQTRSEAVSSEKKQKEEEQRARRQAKDSERSLAMSGDGKHFTQSEAEKLIEETADWEALELGRDGDGGSAIQIFTDPTTGEKFVRRVPVKKGAEHLLGTKPTPPDEK